MAKDTITLILSLVVTSVISGGAYYLLINKNDPHPFSELKDEGENPPNSVIPNTQSENTDTQSPTSEVGPIDAPTLIEQQQALQQQLEQQQRQKLQQQQEELQRQQAALQEKLLQQQAELEAKQRQLDAQSSQVRTSSSSNQQPSYQNSKPNRGMWIVKVNPGEEADEAGLRVGQILVSLNDRYIDQVNDANTVVVQNVNQRIKAVVWDYGQYKELGVVPYDQYMGVTLCSFSNCPNGRLP